MGSDNLFHKRKAKGIKLLKRKMSVRLTMDKVLIVCEGEKTEPYYFQGLINHYKLPSANISVIKPENGNDPLTIVDAAEEKLRDSIRMGDPFDRVYCVFDKDKHGTNYNNALVKISARKDGKIIVANSVPCFEYWILLHFTYTTQAYNDLHHNPASMQLISELKKFVPDYSKGMETLFEKYLVNNVDRALAACNRANLDADRCNTDNPTSRICDLVQYLKDLRK